MMWILINDNKAFFAICIIAIIVCYDPDNQKILPTISKALWRPSSYMSFPRLCDKENGCLFTAQNYMRDLTKYVTSSRQRIFSVPKCDEEIGCGFVKKSAVDGTKPINGTFVDLALPSYKAPMDLDYYRSGYEWQYHRTDEKKQAARYSSVPRKLPYGKASQFLEEAIKAQKQRTDREQFDSKTVAIGSEEDIYYTGDLGLFAAVLEAYNNHWNLRISPDDLWFPIIRRIASLIDDNSGKEKVRRFFVDHEGKKEIIVYVDANTIYQVDYSYVFDQFSEKLKQNIKVPDYAETIQSDFTTTTPELQIVSSITLMASLQQYFEYTMALLCGIKAVEMLGDLKDWEKLHAKFNKMLEILSPIKDELSGTGGFNMTYWTLSVNDTLGKLVSTYKGNSKTEWWSQIVNHEVFYGSGGDPNEFSGWIVELLEGQARVDGLSKFSTGLCTVPMKITDGKHEDMSNLVAGMLGYTIHEGSETANGVPSIRPFQGWALLLPPDSIFRKDRTL